MTADEPEDAIQSLDLVDDLRLGAADIGEDAIGTAQGA